MKLPRRTDERSPTMPLTPLIDIVFLLNIFFLVATYFVQLGPVEAIELTPATQATSTPATNPRLVVTVSAEGTWRGPQGDLDEWSTERLLVELIGTNGVEVVELECRVDRRAPYGAVEPLLMLASRLGVRRLTWTVIAR